MAEWKQSPLHLRNHKDSKSSISKRKISEEQEFREESPMMKSSGIPPKRPGIGLGKTSWAFTRSGTEFEGIK